ncbi:MAG: peptide deformylase, partial [Gammaproteobacteria bacterium]|nr:peptide deformylase [Gammaproteobacteria bacterium]
RPLRREELDSVVLHRLIADMVDTLHDYGGIGLAVPQVNESVRLALIEIPGGPTRYGELDHVPLTVCVNPEIEIVDETAAGYWEGCLSIPGLRGFVERPQHIRVHFLDLGGERRELEATGFLATVFQHEFDHLDGRLFVDRIKDPTRLAFEEEFARYVLPLEREGEPAGESADASA